MASEKTYQALDVLKRAGRWLVWKPWRLVAALVVLFIVWQIVSHLTNSDQENPEVSPTPTVSNGLPSGWQSWPSVTITGAPQAATATASPSTQSSLSTESSAPTASSVSATASSVPTSASSTPPAAVWDTESRQSVLDTAVAGVTAYIDGNQEQLNALLGYEVVVKVNPSSVIINTPDPQMPGLSLPHVTSEFSPESTTVIVPTSGGDYQVWIDRADGGSPWRIQGIVEPEQ